MKPSSFKRVVIKVGSSLLVDRNACAVKEYWLHALCDDLAALKAGGTDVLVVSSGAIALGRCVMGLPDKPLKLEESQAAAAVGQVNLMAAWSRTLSRHNITAGQILLTLPDTKEKEKERHDNARNTLETLLANRCIPVINENDTVATDEIRYGDNDRLAARMAVMTGADGLILLSDIDGLYDSNPRANPSARLIEAVDEITPAIEAMAAGPASVFSRGGMITKIEAAKIATSNGCAVLLGNGTITNPISAIESGGLHTLFNRVQSGDARKQVIPGGMMAQVKSADTMAATP